MDNQVKINAVRLGVGDLLGHPTDVRGVAAESGVPAQPIGDEITRQGASNRARAALAWIKDAAYAVGLEGGVSELADGAL